MQMTIFLVEVLAIYLWLEWEDISKEIKKVVFTEKSIYTSYDNLNEDGYEKLVFNNVSTVTKCILFKNSSLMQDIRDVFPHLSEMQYFVETRIEDKAFREALLEYIGYWHSEYVAGNITMQRLEEKIFYPSSLEVFY